MDEIDYNLARIRNAADTRIRRLEAARIAAQQRQDGITFPEVHDRTSKDQRDDAIQPPPTSADEVSALEPTPSSSLATTSDMSGQFGADDRAGSEEAFKESLQSENPIDYPVAAEEQLDALGGPAAPIDISDEAFANNLSNQDQLDDPCGDPENIETPKPLGESTEARAEETLIADEGVRAEAVEAVEAVEIIETADTSQSRELAVVEPTIWSRIKRFVGL